MHPLGLEPGWSAGTPRFHQGASPCNLLVFNLSERRPPPLIDMPLRGRPALSAGIRLSAASRSQSISPSPSSFSFFCSDMAESSGIRQGRLYIYLNGNICWVRIFLDATDKPPGREATTAKKKDATSCVC